MRKVIIMGAAGRDFHNFNVYYRDNKEYKVIAFTATQIPDIDGRKYPSQLAGSLYPDGIPIYSEEKLVDLIKEYKVDDVVFSYSDTSHQYVMNKASQVISAGANFVLLGNLKTQIKSNKPVIAVCAVRTGVGKSQTTRKVSLILKELGIKTVAIRHPMPYGDLTKQVAMRFETMEDLKKFNCTIEEAEEFAPHIERGNVVYAGVDYAKILHEAEKEADVILWDGGNNDAPFYKPDLLITLVDPLRAGNEISYHPGESNLISADVIVINKVDSANENQLEIVRKNIKDRNPKAIVIEANSTVTVDKPDIVKGKRVLVVEDGPTLTHGNMSIGAGFVAAKKYGAKELVKAKDFAVGTIKETYEKYRQIDVVLPAMGYSEKQIEDLQTTINNSDADVVVIGTPFDIRKVVSLNKPAVRVFYELEEITKPDLKEIITKFVKDKVGVKA